MPSLRVEPKLTKSLPPGAETPAILKSAQTQHSPHLVSLRQLKQPGCLSACVRFTTGGLQAPFAITGGGALSKRRDKWPAAGLASP